jgi:RNA polymerase sigma-70 factor, ECF subfamily
MSLQALSLQRTEGAIGVPEIAIPNFGNCSNQLLEKVSNFMDAKAPDNRKPRKPMNPGDGQLVQRSLGGERAAFDELVRRYQRQTVAVAYRLLGNTQDALEVSQDTFIKAYRSLGTLKKPEAFGGWLMRIATNLALNFRRSRKMRLAQSLSDTPGGADPAAGDFIAAGEFLRRDGDPVRQLQSAEMGARLRQALTQLPEKQRAAIILFTLEQMPQKQVAQSLKCSVEAVKWHVFQGRKKLKELLKEHL